MTDKTNRRGSLQFYPRKRAAKILPSVNWKAVSGSASGSVSASKENKGLAGFIGYKAGMANAYVKDITEDSMTKNKRITIPVTLIECPEMKIFSVRFYKNGKVVKDIVVSNEKELKRKVKTAKQTGKIEDVKDFDDLRIIAYTIVRKTGVKKTPDLIEIALFGTKDEKINFVKEKIGKEISVLDVFKKGKGGVVDVRAVTKGKGLQGTIKRFGIGLKAHKSEKGRRRPGSLAPWHPARVTFRTPMAGQMGFQSRIAYNNLIIDIGKISEKNINKEEGLHKYGKIRTDFLILKGSVPGAKKRQILITPALRTSKRQKKLNYEFISLR